MDMSINIKRRRGFQYDAAQQDVARVQADVGLAPLTPDQIAIIQQTASILQFPAEDLITLTPGIYNRYIIQRAARILHTSAHDLVQFSRHYSREHEVDYSHGRPSKRHRPELLPPEQKYINAPMEQSPNEKLESSELAYCFQGIFSGTSDISTGLLSSTASGVADCLGTLTACPPLSSAPGPDAAGYEVITATTGPSSFNNGDPYSMPTSTSSSITPPEQYHPGYTTHPPQPDWFSENKSDVQTLQNYPPLQPNSVWQPTSQPEVMHYPPSEQQYSLADSESSPDTITPMEFVPPHMELLPTQNPDPAQLQNHSVMPEELGPAVPNALLVPVEVPPLTSDGVATSANAISVPAPAMPMTEGMYSFPIPAYLSTPDTIPLQLPQHNLPDHQALAPYVSGAVDLTIQPTQSRPPASRRGPFRDLQDRQKTAATRKIGSCIRCRMQRIRVSRHLSLIELEICDEAVEDGGFAAKGMGMKRTNPKYRETRDHGTEHGGRLLTKETQCNANEDNPTGECLGCQKSLSRTWRLPCLRLKFSDIVLSKTCQVKGHEWTLRWKENTVLDEVGHWASTETRTVRISEGYTGTYVELRVRQFTPQEGDRLERSWVTPTGETRSVHIPPFAVVDHESIRPRYHDYIRAGLKTCCERVLEEHRNNMIWKTYEKAMQLAAGQTKTTTLTDQEQKLLTHTLDLWMTVRLTTRSFEIVGSETLGMPPDILDETNPSCGKIPLPPVMGAQLDSVLIKGIHDGLRRDTLEALHKLTTENKTRTWFTIYLITFILLHNAALVIKHDASYARKHGIRRRFAREDKVQQYYSGAITLLAYFHYCNKGVFPFTEEANDQDLRRLGNLDQDAMQFVRETKKFAIDNRTRWQVLWETNDYENDFYFISQLYEVKWQPRPMKM